jgi:hypothetical protein
VAPDAFVREENKKIFARGRMRLPPRERGAMAKIDVLLEEPKMSSDKY